MRPLTIDLDRLAAAFVSTNGDFRLDLLSGRILDIPPVGADPQIEQLLEEEPERLLAVDSLTPGAMLALMAEFLPEVEQLAAYTALQAALDSRKPLRSFHNALNQFPDVQSAWQAFEAERLRELALDWLAENELELRV
ncbi:UPF0158 family protein [Aquipseudomonas guryensis]|jgi:hypothetical protein|uniref:Uncharacterized protein n=1 Tax=Aquipseudomonas guryensis TaxID=2759165 RepID=A0A7W4D901_9GAMM|nr:UPF0158 family protein [Pseudomonas guryensis]MBB1518195.1 hypothetical protein [Pseudomonas guryensis]